MVTLATRVKFLMMDERSALAARLIAEGGTFWAAGAGALTVARSGTVLTVGGREAEQVCALLRIDPAHAPQRLAPAGIDPVLRDMLLGGDVEEAAQERSPVRERALA
ncbi:hypothetical protein [Ramlibacter sp. AN1133]|uniref:hypothetical protein n=1 Tax=Ramlibacter sp. AN1133 TaxID=3133429 RepID=UPI0030C2CF00